jgi:hypothetical protein
MSRCPLCGHKRTERPNTLMRARLEAVGDVYSPVAVGASRWYRHKLAERWPQLEFRHERDGEHWTIYARRRA